MAQELRKAREDLTRLTHQIELGKDPALGTGGAGARAFRADEAITGSRIENSIGRRLQRVPNDKSPRDWYDPKSGKVYDAASPTPTKYFDKPGSFENWTGSIQAHFKKSGVDVVVVDIAQRGLNPVQAAKVKNYIASLPASQRSRILILA